MLEMTEQIIYKYLEDLNGELVNYGTNGDICLVGGAAMCLVFKARVSTHDLDAIFEPKNVMYDCIRNVAYNNDIPEDWLNDSVKGFMSQNSEFKLFVSYSNLNIYTASSRYMLAMKCLASRVTNNDERNDIKFLIDYIGLKTYNEIEEIILSFYSPRLFETKTKYLIMELLQEMGY